MDSLTTYKHHNGYAEEMVVLDETKEVFKYTLSNSLDDIKIAIYARTGCNINLNKAAWKLNTGLSISVKHLMNSHNVNYSMTTDTRKKSRFIAINMRVGDKWFVTGYDEISGVFYNWEYLKTFKETIDFLKDHFASDDDDDSE